MDDFLHDLFTAVLPIVGAAGEFAHHIETRVLVLLGATPQRLAVTSFRMFPSPEVIEYINIVLSDHSQMVAPEDTRGQLRGLEQLLGLGMLALIVPYFVLQNYSTKPKSIVTSALASLLATHWTVAYLIALVRTWTLSSIWYTALYHLVAGHAGTFTGLFLLFAMSCT